MAVFWVIAPCSLVEVYRRFRGDYCLHNQGAEAASTSETLVNFYHTTRRNNPENNNLHPKNQFMILEGTEKNLYNKEAGL
jgi:hypothetical protein